MHAIFSCINLLYTSYSIATLYYQYTGCLSTTVKEIFDTYSVDSIVLIASHQ